MFTKQHRRTRNRNRRSQRVNWALVGCNVFYTLLGALVALCGLGMIYFGG